MSVDIQWQRFTSKSTSPRDHRHHLVNIYGTGEREKEELLKRRSAPSVGVSANEFKANLPSAPQLPPILSQRHRSPLRYANLPKVGLNSRYSVPKSFTVCSKVTEEKPSIFNPEPVPFTTGRLRCSTVLKKVPIIRKLNDGVPYGVYCSPALLFRTKGFVVRATGRQQSDEAKGGEWHRHLNQPGEDLFSPSKSKVPFFHASRALFTDPPGSCIVSKDEGIEQSQCRDDTLEVNVTNEMSLTNEDGGMTRGMSPLNEADDLPPVNVYATDRPLPHEGTSIYWPPPPPPVSTDPTLLYCTTTSNGRTNAETQTH